MQRGQPPKVELLSKLLRHCPQNVNCSSTSSSLSFTTSSLHVTGTATGVVRGWERLLVVVVMLVVREELTLAMLDTTGSVELTAGAG